MAKKFGITLSLWLNIIKHYIYIKTQLSTIKNSYYDYYLGPPPGAPGGPPPRGPPPPPGAGGPPPQPATHAPPSAEENWIIPSIGNIKILQILDNHSE